MATFSSKLLLSKKGVRLGSRKKDYAGNEYILLAGVASLAVGDAVVFDPTTFVPTRLSTSTAVAQPAAIAMAANTSATVYSWYQVEGLGTATAAGTVASGAYLQSTATAGQIDDTTTAGKTIFGCLSAGAGTTGSTLAVWLSKPFYANAALA
jgi:hypothetical protein